MPSVAELTQTGRAGGYDGWASQWILYWRSGGALHGGSMWSPPNVPLIAFVHLRLSGSGYIRITTTHD